MTDSPRPIRAVAFDLDGLIFNTEHVFAIAARQMLGRRGLELPGELLRRMMGRRPPEGFIAMREMLRLEEPLERLEAEARELFEALLDEHLAPMPGVFDLLDLLDRRGLPRAIATSSPRRYLEDLFRRFDLGSRFEFALTAEDVTQGKPHPEIYLTAAARLGVEPSEMAVFEDSETGSQAAVAAGAVVFAVPHEYSADHAFPPGANVVPRLLAPEVLDRLG